MFCVNRRKLYLKEEFDRGKSFLLKGKVSHTHTKCRDMDRENISTDISFRCRLSRRETRPGIQPGMDCTETISATPPRESGRSGLTRSPNKVVVPEYSEEKRMLESLPEPGLEVTIRGRKLVAVLDSGSSASLLRKSVINHLRHHG